MKLSDIKRILSEESIHLTKSLGQNFLHDQNQIERIAKLAQISSGEKVLEVGPGLGPLTEALLARGAQVLAIDTDAKLVRYLTRRFRDNKGLRVIHEDALQFVKRGGEDLSEYKLVSNLPYSIASPLLVELSLYKPPPALIVATLQLEVARRVMARTNEEEYGVLSLLLQLIYEPVEWIKIPPGSFFPEPNVDSACVKLQRRTEPLLPAEAQGIFRKLVKRGFSQRRKMMLKLLKQDWPADVLEAAFAELALSPQVRAEKVSLFEFCALSEFLTSHTRPKT